MADTEASKMEVEEAASSSVLGKRKAPEADPKLAAKILTQVEFYFSDSNLPRDKFMNELTQKNDGWVPIATIASFKRMRQLTEDMPTVVEALRSSPELLLVDEKGENIRRSRPLPTKEEIEKQKLCTVKFSFFPRENATLESVTEVFAKFGKINSVRMMRKEGNFLGCGFIEFSSEAEAKALIESPPKCAENDEKPLKVQSHADWVADRQKRRKEQSKPQKNGDKSEPQGDQESKADQPQQQQQEAPAAKALSFEKDRVFELSKLPAECTFINVKEALSENLFPEAVQGGKNLFYVALEDSNAAKKPKTATKEAEQPAQEKPAEEAQENSKEAENKKEEVEEEVVTSFKTATVRLYDASSHSASTCLKMLSEKDVKICNVKPESRLVTGDEEAEHWSAYFARKRGGGRGRGRGGRGGRGRGGRGGRGGQKRRRF